MNHPNCDYFKFIDGMTPEIFGLNKSLDYLNDKLEDSIKNSIRDNNIYITFPSGPGSIIKTRLNNEEQISRLIIIDKTLTYNLLKFDHIEIAAEILHEVGHFLNKPPDERNKEKEYYADDFARKCGLGDALQSGFVKYIDVIESYSDQSSGRYFFRNFDEQNRIIKMFQDRIDRIQANSSILEGKIDKIN